ncbi:DUF4132 domain-containing protein [Actinomadura algeriensis]|uniref:DUF4132 domain-containing protein n=1 Tax=Actinomadura algeriensis TaxID=1679523 RepID=A0ABR9K325_9ACTN|nr:DUF4132 domain-containing protein [Actinomadura algeriensis]MBE1537233.1 hypothetical protein [Actinomadura algeriensis]
MNEQSPELPDETVLALPDAWLRALHPRRGGVPVPVAQPVRTAPRRARELVDEHAAGIGSLTAGGYGDPALADAARRYLAGKADPAGAAAVALVSAGTRPESRRASRAIFDAWIVEHGLAFAACALVELGRTSLDRERPGDRIGAVHLPGGESPRIDGALRQRARALLAAAGDGEYDEAVRRLEGHRATVATRALVAYLVPTRQDWVAESCAEVEAGKDMRNLRWLTLYSIGEPLGPEWFASPLARLRYDEAHPSLLATLIDGVGAGVLPYLLDTARETNLSRADHRNLFDAVGLLPTDEAFRALLDRRDGEHARRALLAAMRRFPVRALRLLAAADARGLPGDLLVEHVRAHPRTVEEVLPALPAEVRTVVERVAASQARVPDAPPAAVPDALADPVWRRPAVKPVMAGLEPSATRATEWRDGEREEWLATETPRIPVPADPHWERLAESCRSGSNSLEEAQLLLHGPENLLRPFLAGWSGYFGDDGRAHMRVLVARHGREVYDAATRLADLEPALNGDVLLPFLDAATAARACGWAVRRAPVDEAGLAWLDRHGTGAVPFLVPEALGGKVRPRRAAETGLRRIAARCGVDEVVAAAPPRTREAIRTLLAAHPAETGLVAVGEPGDWADPAVLPQVLLRGRERALPAGATRALLELLTLPASATADAIGGVRDACDPESVAAFGLAVFDRWLAAGGESKQVWALDQLGVTGDDGTVRRLAPLVRAWGDGGGVARAVHGLDALAGIGSDAAMGALYEIALKTKSSKLWKEARRKFDRAAADRGLTPERFADRLVPDFGLDAAGSMVLDYGPRRFTVGFDEWLKPFVADESGRPRKSLPKPGAKDDPGRAPAAHAAFTTLKREVRAVATDQCRRLQRAMTAGRRWEAAEFRDHVAGHPLVRHLARRLVWTAHDGAATAVFRVAEDGTFADVRDDAFTVADSARIGLPHPLRLGAEAVAAWSEVFADYEILQPFPQLGRPVIVLTERERDGDRLERFAGVRLTEADVLALWRRGWNTDSRSRFERTIAGVHRVHAEVESRGDDQIIGTVRLGGGARTFGELDPVLLSETLTALTGPSG